MMVSAFRYRRMAIEVSGCGWWACWPVSFVAASKPNRNQARPSACSFRFDLESLKIPRGAADSSRIVKLPLRWTVLAIRVAILLIPGWAVAGSQLATSAQDAPTHATARVDFKIVIPRVLSLSISDANVVSVVSNGRRQLVPAHAYCENHVSSVTCTAATP
jgi:hypothetical protein